MFNINFFELSFLVEACIPPRPIARTMFFHKVIDTYYHQFSKEQRKALYEWIENSLDLSEEDCVIFDCRYNPNNQYLVTSFYDGKEEQYETFKRNEIYYTSRQSYISPEYIIKVEKI